jgi:hypothetical protein
MFPKLRGQWSQNFQINFPDFLFSLNSRNRQEKAVDVRKFHI